MSKDIAKSPTRPAWAAELTAKQMLFVQAYASTLNATKAALHAGYAKSGARVRGHDLRRKKHVQEADREASRRAHGRHSHPRHRRN